MFRELGTALRLLTILPAPGREAERLDDALPWFPLVGCLLGAVLLGLARTAGVLAGGWPEGAAAVVLAGSVFLTRGMHLDGLADCTDGFGGGRDRAHTLAIMKDSHVGAFGVIALVLILLFKWAALSRIIGTGHLHWIVAAGIVSRTTMVELAVWLPYARAEGGTAGPFVNGARSRHRLVAWVLSLTLLLSVSGPAGVILAAGGWTGCRLLGGWFKRRVGGVTGDLLGACHEIVETGALFTCAAADHWMAQFTGWL